MLRLLLLFGLAFALVGCGGGDDTETTTADPTEVALETSTLGTTVDPQLTATPVPAPATAVPLPTSQAAGRATPTVSVVLSGTAFTNQSKVSTAGIDEVIFGTEATAAAEAASTLWAGLPEGSWPQCFIVIPANGPEGIEFWVWSKLIERVEITNPGLRTRSGYGVGTQIGQLQAELGDLITVEDLDDGSQRATFTPSDPTDQYRLIFEIEDGEVTRYSSGRTSIVELGTGACGASPNPDQIAVGEPFVACQELGLRSVSETLPPVVRAKAQQVQEAAGDCDVAALQAITAPEFTASFGGGTFAEVYERNGLAVTELTRLMSLEPAINTNGSYVWPRAFAVGWEEVTPEMLDELRTLGYDDDDFATFESFGGFIGFRAMITAEGAWTAYVAGD